MEEIQLAVCDDVEFYIEEIEKLMYAYENESGYRVKITPYTSGEALIQDMKSGAKTFSVIIIDVEMPGRNGVDVVREIRTFNESVVVCFATCHPEYALPAFAIEALGYLVKPVQYAELKKVLSKALILVRHQKDVEEADKRYITIKVGRGESIIDTRTIQYIEKRMNRSVFHMTTGEQACYDTLNNIYKRLDQQMFIYSHAGFIVNFALIKEVKKDVICFGHGTEAPVSRKHYAGLREMHMNKLIRLQEERRLRAQNNSHF